MQQRVRLGYVVGGDEEKDLDDGRNAREFMILEFMENGDLNSLLNRSNQVSSAPIPNRVLWSFFLCCECPSPEVNNS